jgi:hypothetical protein
MQDSSGGWPLRRGEHPKATFAFYPSLALTQVYRAGINVAISFAGADRKVALSIAERIKKAGFRVFYDHDHRHSLLGEDLTSFLQKTYANESRFVVVLVSRAFLTSLWAGNWEWRAVLARMQRQQTGYILPYILEEAELPGLNPTLGYVSANDFSPEAFAELVIRKVRSQLS